MHTFDPGQIPVRIALSESFQQFTCKLYISLRLLETGSSRIETRSFPELRLARIELPTPNKCHKLSLIYTVDSTDNLRL